MGNRLLLKELNKRLRINRCKNRRQLFVRSSTKHLNPTLLEYQQDSHGKLRSYPFDFFSLGIIRNNQGANLCNALIYLIGLPLVTRVTAAAHETAEPAAAAGLEAAAYVLLFVEIQNGSNYLEK